MRSLILKSIGWTVVLVFAIWFVSVVLVFSSFGICGPHGFRADVSKWILFPAMQIPAMFERDYKTPGYAVCLGIFAQLWLWFWPTLAWQRRKMRRTQQVATQHLSCTCRRDF